jgi:hypothetical protein
VDHIVIRNVSGSFGSFGTLRGNLPNAQRGTLGDTLGEITFENINVKLASAAPLARGEVEKLTFKNVVINGEPVEAPLATAQGAAGRRGAGANRVSGTAGASSPAGRPAEMPAQAAPNDLQRTARGATAGSRF